MKKTLCSQVLMLFSIQGLSTASECFRQLAISGRLVGNWLDCRPTTTAIHCMLASSYLFLGLGTIEHCFHRWGPVFGAKHTDLPLTLLQSPIAHKSTSACLTCVCVCAPAAPFIRPNSTPAISNCSSQTYLPDLHTCLARSSLHQGTQTVQVPYSSKP